MAATAPTEPTLKTHHRFLLPGREEPFWIPKSVPLNEAQQMAEERMATGFEERQAPGPSFGETTQIALENILPAAGGAVGGFAGAASPVPGGAMIGAGLGVMGGRALAGATKPLLMPEAEPESMLEQFRASVQEGLIGGITEGALPVVGRPLRHVPRVIGNLARRAAIGNPPEEVLTAAKALRSRGAEFSMGELAGERRAVTGVVEAIAENSLTGAGRFAKFRESQTLAIKQLTDDISAGVRQNLNPSQASRLLLDTIRGNDEAFHAASRAMYQQVDQMAQGATVNTSALYRFMEANKKSKHFEALKNIAFPARGEMEELLLTDVPDVGRVTNVAFKGAQEARTRLLMAARETKNATDPEGVAVHNIARKAAALLDGAVDTASQNLTPEAREAFRAANTFYKGGQEQFRNEFLLKIMKGLEAHPGQLDKVLLKPKGVDDLKRLKQALGSQKYEELVQPQLAAGFIARATDERTGVVTANAIYQQIKNLGPETIDAGMSPGTTSALRNLANTIDIIDKNPAKGRVSVTLSQFGTAAQLAAGVDILMTPFGTGLGEATFGTPTPLSASATILVAPWAASWLLTKPAAIRALTEGMKAGYVETPDPVRRSVGGCRPARSPAHRTRRGTYGIRSYPCRWKSLNCTLT